MATHNAPLAHIAYQQPDGTTGVLDPHDVLAMHNDPNVVKTENIEDRAVTNGKIAAGAVTEVELANGSVTQEKLAEDVWDSISQAAKDVQIAVENALAPVPLTVNVNATGCTCNYNARRLGRLVVVSGTIMPKTSGASLKLLEVLGGRALTTAYGPAVQYNGAAGKVYAVAGGSGTTYLNFDIPDYGVNYNFSISYWV